MGVKVSNVIYNDDVRVEVLDSIGDKYHVDFSENSQGKYELERIVLPDDYWDVDVFQEVIEVRDEAIQTLIESEEQEIANICMNMSQIMTRTAAERVNNNNDSPTSERAT